MGEHLEVDQSRCLPPQEYWLVDGRDKLPTPVDDRGLVDTDLLIAQLLETIDPEYVWQGKSNIHHFYWPDAEYPHEHGKKQFENLALFRNMPINKGLVPVLFHNWLHRITEPPPMPSAEVIAYRSEAWMTAESLFKSCRKYKQWERRAHRRRKYIEENPQVLQGHQDQDDAVAQEIIAEVLERHFNGMSHHRTRMRCIPPEFRIVDPDMPIEKLATNLGKLVAPSALRLNYLVLN